MKAILKDCETRKKMLDFDLLFGKTYYILWLSIQLKIILKFIVQKYLFKKTVLTKNSLYEGGACLLNLNFFCFFKNKILKLLSNKL